MASERMSRDSSGESESVLSARHKEEDRLNKEAKRLEELFGEETPNSLRLELAVGKNVREWTDQIKILPDGTIIRAEVDSNYGDSENFYVGLRKAEGLAILEESLKQLKEKVKEHELAIEKLKKI